MSFDFWRENNFRLEPWGSDYQPPIDIEELSESASEVDATVEETDWSKFCKRRPQIDLPQRLIFIDGRRRIDAALVGGSGNTINYGVFGTIAVGAVLVDRSTHTAKSENFNIRRILGFGGNQKAPLTHIPCPFGSGAELVYEPAEPYVENNPDIRKNLVQNAMLKAEATLAKQNYTMQADTLVIRDGRLPYNSPNFTVGYVKTMHKNYLSEKHADLLWELKPTERSPIFLIKEQNRPHWSWYLKSGNSQTNSQSLGYHDLHGIVRLELSNEIPLETAQKIADQTTYLIPEYASHPYKDPRAPQNLTPVGALERELGRRMGDANLIKRRVQHYLASLGVTP
ncbi:hypothetical protein [Brasilonema octagenarum]|uniref:NurA domain-containing protein n=1 Tax=Brasilonema octagenarum UFV-OR1 TaxID=417115 RepID=A0ABX1M2R0_9CYAN|nr:hypothetical protein [Brasilonema octagenarum]NMF62080.1 hypothetical protein [Brasilonema octagenarum UFV-OR1]